MLRPLGSVICVVGLSGCFLEPDQVLDVAVRLPDTVATAGGQFLFQVHATNRGADAIEVEVGTCPPRFRVLDAGGDRIPLPGVSCPAMLGLPTVTLGPGESYLIPQVWFIPGRLPVGEYQLQAWVTPTGGDTVHSRAVRLRVRAPSP